MMRIIPPPGRLASLAVSLTLWGGLAMAQVPVNSVNDGQIIHGGTYANTPTGETTFKNSTGGGLWLQTGSNLRGVEVDTIGNYTNRGGTLHFDAPGQVVRLDGNVDVRGLQNGSGTFLGSGGNVFVDSAYLYQSGNIYANGVNGGLIQFNVGSATLVDTARIEAKGFGGVGGQVVINASGSADIQRQAIIDTSGLTLGQFDSNVINIEGGLVNVEGTLQANGIQAKGGLIRLVSTGQTDLSQTQAAIQDATNAGTFSNTDASSINNHLTTLKTNYDGDTRIASGNDSARQAIVIAQGLPGTAVLSSNGNTGNDSADPDPRAGDGGTIIVAAQNRILNGGWLLVDGAKGVPDTAGNPTNGGNGGTLSLNARNEIITSGRISANGGQGSNSDTANMGGKGGDAGLIAFSYKNGLSNTGPIIAIGGQGATTSGQGGNGGLIVFSSARNPAGSGQVVTFGGFGSTRGALGSVIAPDPASSLNTLIGVWRKTQPTELLLNGNNLLLLRNDLPGATTDGNQLDHITYNAQIRSIRNQQGEAPQQHFGPAENELLSKEVSGLNPQQGGKTYFNNFVFASTRTDNVAVDVSRLNRNTGELKRASLFRTQTNLSSGGINEQSPVRSSVFSSISNGYSQTEIASSRGINIAADNIADMSGFIDVKFVDQGGSLIIKAGNLLSLPINSSLITSGNETGGSQQLLAGNTFTNRGAIESTSSSTAGNIYIHAPNQLLNAPGSIINVFSEQYGGTIKLKSLNIQNQGTLDVSGGTQDGQIILDNTP